MREHRRTRLAGRPAREHQRRQMIGVDVDTFDRFRGQQIIDEHLAIGRMIAITGDDGRDRRDRGAIDVGPCRRAQLLDHDHRRADVRDLRLELRCGAERVQRDGDRAEPECGVVGDHEVIRVAAQQRHTIAVTNAERCQPTAQAVDLLTESTVGRRSPTMDQRDRVVGMVVDDAGEIHLRPPR